jgi:hypothetical protein
LVTGGDVRRINRVHDRGIRRILTDLAESRALH